MTRHRKIDANHGQIVKALRAIGATVHSLASLGAGCPDLVVGRLGKNYLLEIKDGARCPSERRLTEDEKSWHASWRGQVCVVNSVDEALKAVGAV